MKKISACTKCGGNSKRFRVGLCTTCYNKQQSKKRTAMCKHCGKPNKRSLTGPCGTCYRRSWYNNLTPGEKKEYIQTYVYEWQQNNPEKREAIAKRWRIKTGRQWPQEFKNLFKANKNLEQVLAAAEDDSGVRQPDQLGSDDGIERTD